MDAFLDRPADRLDLAVAFWASVTGADPAPQKDPGFVRLHTAAGDDWLEIQGVRAGPGGHHPDFWVDDLAGFNSASTWRRRSTTTRSASGRRSPDGASTRESGPTSSSVRFLLQRLGEERAASVHLDVSCSDVPAARPWHESLGATFVGEWPSWSTFRDPAGGLYCLTRGNPAED